ncbi:dystrophin-like isoform X1 [Dendronephthya gigantea]|uniref:dystrophin-like isoform X1 n=1 Tax=Dendronephthya gigantea TaxID=151771 RepID=UPI001069ABB9|nr:dystrophin-like isoform X1 [Dendronephthya gigantea]
MQETSSSLNPPANNLPRVRVQITTLKVMLMMTVVIIVIMTVIMIGYSDCAVNGWLLMMILVCLAMMTLLTMSLEQQHSTSVAIIQDTEGKVKKMVDTSVMTEGDSAGMSDEKEKIKNIADVIEDAEPKLIKRYIELLRREIEKRKQWLDANEEEITRSKVDFKDFSEFKIVYFRNKDLAKELDDNNVHVLIEETNKFDGIEPDLKQQLVVLNERWIQMDVALKDKNELYDNLMADWTKYREQQLIFLNWIDEIDSEVKNEKGQVNLVDEDEIYAHIMKLKDVENKAESEGAMKERNLREAGEDLIRHVGEDSSTAVEICKQTEEIVSAKHEFLKDLSVRIQKIESSEQKTQDLYNDFDDVTDWLDATESLIDKYESHDKETADDDSPRKQLMPQDEEVEEMASVAEEIMINFEKLSETDSKVKHVNTLGNELKEEIAEEGREGVDAKLDAFNQRYNNVSQRIKDFENKEPQTSSGCSEFVRRIRRKLFQVFK